MLRIVAVSGETLRSFPLERLEAAAGTTGFGSSMGKRV
jgi:hypothetical protein